MRVYKDKFLIEFKKRCAEDPGLTGFIHLGRMIQGKRWDEAMIKHKFHKCLSLKDYPEFTLDEVVQHFLQLSYLKNT